MTDRPFRKVLCANRGEIAIRVFRACAELGIRTVAIFSEEDATNQHRYKADESYLVGKGKGAVQAYLAGDEILEIVRDRLADILEIEPSGIGEGQSFVDDLEADSLALIELVEALEEALSGRIADFRIDDEDLEDLKTGRDAVDYVRDRATS